MVKVGRVWPRPGHRGRPLNFIVRHSSVEPASKGEKVTRFGCGFVFGAFAAALAVWTWSLLNGLHLLAAVAGFGLICGMLAVRFGDKFWHSIPKWWWPWY